MSLATTATLLSNPRTHLIADYNVTNSPNDNSQLSAIAISAKDTFGAVKLDAVGDKGFFNFVEIKKCAHNGITPYVPEQNRYGVGLVKRTDIPSRDFHSDKFVYERKTDMFLCPAGQTLKLNYLNPCL